MPGLPVVGKAHEDARAGAPFTWFIYGSSLDRDAFAHWAGEHGYHLIRKYGCYGCHEVNGFDGPARRIGPDLRSEPNYFAVAQQIDAELTAAGKQSGVNEIRGCRKLLTEL